VHRGAGDKTAEAFYRTRTSSVAWHSDVSYELQPPGTTFLYILDVPDAGGDTLFSSQVEAYNRLSPAFQERLHGLKAMHSGIEQVEASRNKGGAVRREPVRSVHPIVRTHPVTGEKALYVNPQCKFPRMVFSPFVFSNRLLVTRSIVGYKQEESDALLVSIHPV
jgi:sulfonate dioxygenase